MRPSGRLSAPGAGLRAFYLAVIGAWLLGAELIVIVTVRGTLPRPVGGLGGGTFVVASAVLLYAVGRRDLANRREIARLLHRHQEALASLSALTDASLAVLPLDRLLDELLARLQEVLSIETAAIFLLAEGGAELEVRAWRGMEELASGAVRLQLREGLARQIASSRAPIVVDDVAASDVSPSVLRGLASLAGCPIVVQGRLIGLCLVGSHQRMRFTDRDIQLLQLVSDRAGVGIERSRLDEAERRSRLAAEQARRHLALLARAAETLSTALQEYEPSLAALVDVVVPEFADWCAVHVVEPESGLRSLAVRHGDERGAQCSAQFAERLTEWPELADKAVVQGGPQLHWSRPHGPKDGADDDREGRSYLVAPIRARGRTVGLITCVTDHDRRGYRMSDLSVAEELAGRASITVERVLLYREVKNSAEASARSAARWRALIEATPAGIVEIDLAGRIVVWNRSAATMFDWPDEPDSSQTAPAFPKGAAARIAALCLRAVEGKKSLTTELSGVEAGGHRRDLTVSAAPLVGPDGSVESVLTLAVDVTERKLLEEGMREAQRMEAIGQVAGGVAHDFNNLLTVITGYTDLVRRQPGLDESSREMLEGISDAAGQAALLTGQLLTIGRRQEAKPVVLEPSTALRSLAEVLERILGIDVALRWSLDPESGNIHIDPARFEQLILNLAINGRDAMPSGGQLEIATECAFLGADEAGSLDLEPGRYVRVTVADTGVGMGDETRRRCFEAFFTTKERSKGTGLGLAAVHGIVQEGGGTITVSSELGRGTRFDIYLPRSEDNVAAQAADLPPADLRGAETVLVVEDQMDVRRLICRVLGRAGYLVLEAADGSTALKISERWEGPIELILTDVVMPDMRGPEVVELVKKTRPSMAVLYVSGYTDGTTVPAGLAADTVGFLAKPFKPSELSARVRDVLDEHRRQARSGSRRP